MHLDNKIRLVDLVVARLNEEFPDHVVRAKEGTTNGTETFTTVYVDNICMAVVGDRKVTMHIDKWGDSPGATWYDAADPNFFYHVTQHARAAIYFFQEQANEALLHSHIFITSHDNQKL